MIPFVEAVQLQSENADDKCEIAVSILTKISLLNCFPKRLPSPPVSICLNQLLREHYGPRRPVDSWALKQLVDLPVIASDSAQDNITGRWHRGQTVRATQLHLAC
jgi:hypothetical protein